MAAYFCLTFDILNEKYALHDIFSDHSNRKPLKSFLNHGKLNKIYFQGKIIQANSKSLQKHSLLTWNVLNPSFCWI